MKIAIARDQERVSGHFGHCEGFQVFTVENNEVKESIFLENPGHKPGILPKYLKENNINTIISGGMGRMAQNLFEEQNINVVVGAEGLLSEAILEYIKGSLESTNSVCDDHNHSDSCGNH